jgi:hypothetical protein
LAVVVEHVVSFDEEVSNLGDERFKGSNVVPFDGSGNVV